MNCFQLQNDISSYIVEDVQANPNQFSAPNADDIHTVYVPFENAVNVPATYDVRWVHYTCFKLRSNLGKFQHKQWAANSSNVVQHQLIYVYLLLLFSVASSFGYSGGAPSQQAGTGAAPPNYR